LIVADLSSVLLAPNPSRRVLSRGELLTLVLYWDRLVAPSAAFVTKTGTAHFEWIPGTIVASADGHLSIAGDIAYPGWPGGRNQRDVLFDRLRTEGVIESVEVVREDFPPSGLYWPASSLHALEQWEAKAYDYAAGANLGVILTSPRAIPRPALELESTLTPEVSLVRAAGEGFSLADDADVNDVLSFRARNQRQLLGLRAALFDLSSYLAEASDTSRAMISARDVIRHRVEPALSDLEDALKEGRLRFMWRSIIGAATLFSGASVPAAIGLGAAGVATETINYRFNRGRLRKQHPFAFLSIASGALQAGAHPTEEPDAQPVASDWVEIALMFGPNDD